MSEKKPNKILDIGKKIFSPVAALFVYTIAFFATVIEKILPKSFKKAYKDKLDQLEASANRREVVKDSKKKEKEKEKEEKEAEKKDKEEKRQDKDSSTKEKQNDSKKDEKEINDTKEVKQEVIYDIDYDSRIANEIENEIMNLEGMSECLVEKGESNPYTINIRYDNFSTKVEVDNRGNVENTPPSAKIDEKGNINGTEPLINAYVQSLFNQVFAVHEWGDTVPPREVIIKDLLDSYSKNSELAYNGLYFSCQKVNDKIEINVSSIDDKGNKVPLPNSVSLKDDDTLALAAADFIRNTVDERLKAAAIEYQVSHQEFTIKNDEKENDSYTNTSDYDPLASEPEEAIDFSSDDYKNAEINSTPSVTNDKNGDGIEDTQQGDYNLNGIIDDYEM